MICGRMDKAVGQIDTQKHTRPLPDSFMRLQRGRAGAASLRQMQLPLPFTARRSSVFIPSWLNYHTTVHLLHLTELLPQQHMTGQAPDPSRLGWFLASCCFPPHPPFSHNNSTVTILPFHARHWQLGVGSTFVHTPAADSSTTRLIGFASLSC
jgi:hypothetical protein